MRGFAALRSIAPIVVLVLCAVAGGGRPASADGVRSDLLMNARLAMERFDYKSALDFARPLAEAGNAEAQGDLGWMYFAGRGVKQDCEQALTWLRKSVTQGNAFSQQVLGGMYKTGDCVPQDLKAALAWLRRSAEQGYFPAQYSVGLLYKDGKGVPQDYVRAHMWFNLAVSTSSGALGKIARDNVGRQMTSAQIEQAEKMATKCRLSSFKDCG